MRPRPAIARRAFAAGLALCLALAGQAFGAVTVMTGEHGSFTRIALDFGHPVDWEVGRTKDGYALRIKGKTPTYDLKGVYRPIGRKRIASLWVDPAGGDFRLAIACACYALPFAFRPSIVVIDIKNGKPPQSSAFEKPLPPLARPTHPVQTTPPAPKQPAPPEDSGPVYDWVHTFLAGDRKATGSAVPAPSVPLPVARGLEPLRKALIEEMSRGAAAGLLDLTLPKRPNEGKAVNYPSASFTLGDSPNLTAHLGAESKTPVTATGGDCIPDDELDVTSWAISHAPIAEQMATSMTGLVGEFDRADPAAVSRAVRFDLYLGFGSEAVVLMKAFPPEEALAKVWRSIAATEDGLPDKANAFHGMAACDNAAALWAALSSRDLSQEPAVNGKAIVRAFSALPAHLRALLGSRLVDRLLAIHDDAAANSVRDAAVRQPGARPADVSLLEAKVDASQGNLAAAAKVLKKVASSPGPGKDKALAELVRTTAMELKPVSAQQVDALSAIARERRKGPQAGQFQSALALGRAAAGQFGPAFASLDKHPEIVGTVWKILSVLGTDSNLMNYAVLKPGAKPPAAAAPAAERIASRLLSLGFPDSAAAWLARVPNPDPKLMAKLALARGDGQSALMDVAGMKDPAAAALKARSLTLTGNHRAAADVYQRLGNTAAYWSAESQARDWRTLAGGGPGPWSEAAKELISSTAPSPAGKNDPASGTLARARAILASSQSTRAAIDALLRAVPQPAVPTH